MALLRLLISSLIHRSSLDEGVCGLNDVLATPGLFLMFAGDTRAYGDGPAEHDPGRSANELAFTAEHAGPPTFRRSGGTRRGNTGFGFLSPSFDVGRGVALWRLIALACPWHL